MGVFTGSESLSVWGWAIRGVVAYLFLLVTARLLGQRALSELRFLDFVTALVLGNILAHPLSDQHLGLLGSMITTLVLILLHFAGVLLSLKSESARRFLESSPVILIRQGQIDARGLAKARLSVEALLSELRKSQVTNLKRVAFAQWEPGGKLSVFLQPGFEPATRSDLGIASTPFAMPNIVIKEGQVDLKALHELGKDEEWLRQAVQQSGGDLAGVLLATLDANGQFHLVTYPPR